jgi:L-alanine-DL-glutamate epimerase-like enolase superfamily enzyme
MIRIALGLGRLVLGKTVDIRADANMAWSVEEAQKAMRDLSDYGVRSFEQPIASADVSGLARLTRESGLADGRRRLER